MLLSRREARLRMGWKKQGRGFKSLLWWFPRECLVGDRTCCLSHIADLNGTS